MSFDEIPASFEKPVDRRPAMCIRVNRSIGIETFRRSGELRTGRPFNDLRTRAHGPRRRFGERTLFRTFDSTASPLVTAGSPDEPVRRIAHDSRSFTPTVTVPGPPNASPAGRFTRDYYFYPKTCAVYTRARCAHVSRRPWPTRTFGQPV